MPDRFTEHQRLMAYDHEIAASNALGEFLREEARFGRTWVVKNLGFWDRVKMVFAFTCCLFQAEESLERVREAPVASRHMGRVKIFALGIPHEN